MFGADRRIIKTCRDRMSGRNLPGGILQHIRISSLQNSRRTSAEARGMFTQMRAAPARLHTDELYLLVFYELVKDADGVRSPANTGDDCLRKFAFGLKNLHPGLASSNFVKIAHHGRIRMRAQHTAQQ